MARPALSSKCLSLSPTGKMIRELRAPFRDGAMQSALPHYTHDFSGPRLAGVRAPIVSLPLFLPLAATVGGPGDLLPWN